MAGAPFDTVKQIMESITTDQAVSILDECGITQSVCCSIMERIQYHIQMRTKGAVCTEVIIFSAQDRIIASSQGADKMMRALKENPV